jgi:hypothetical protein
MLKVLRKIRHSPGHLEILKEVTEDRFCATILELIEEFACGCGI